MPAVGDLHGDMAKAVESLQLAGVLRLNEKDECIWCGGNTTVVQLGDVLDRGDDEIGELTQCSETYVDIGYTTRMENACILFH